MGSSLRIDYPGAGYHVQNRSRQSEEIRTGGNDDHLFAGMLQAPSALGNVQNCTYCLMPNY